MSLKKMFILALSIGGLATAFQLKAHARPCGHGPHIVKEIFRDVDLSADQKTALRELRPTKEERHEMKAQFRGEKETLSFLKDFIEGSSSREDILVGIEDKMSLMHDFKQEKLLSMFDVLSTLNADQRTQVLDNLSEMQERHAEREETTGLNGKKSQKGKANGKAKKERLLEGISLDAKQQSYFALIQETREAQYENHSDIRKENHERMVSFVSGTKSKDDIVQEIEADHTARIQEKKDNAGLWMDFVDSLHPKQKEQLLSNLEEMKEAFQEKRRTHHKKWEESE